MYSRWANPNEYSNILTKIDLKKNIDKSGIQMMYKGKEIYIDDGDMQNLIIGSTGSGKTQSIVLPLLKTSIKAGESFIINDIKGDICKSLGDILKNNGYKIYAINFKNTSLGNNLNPLSLPYRLFKEDNKTGATKIIDNLAHYLFNDKNTMDPFWINSASNYFTGLCLYLFENAKEEEINLNSVFSLSNSINNEKNIDVFLKKIDKNSNIYYNLSGTLTSPPETRGGIISTFNEKIKKYISSEEISNILAHNDIDITKIQDEKTAIFIITGIDELANSLVPLIIDETICAIDNYSTHNKRLNIIIDEFESLTSINNYPKLLNYARSLNIRFTNLINNYKGISNNYGKETGEILKASFGNIIYLLSNDLDTITEISYQCGNIETKNKIKPLITPEELRTIKAFEAIVLKQRMMPFKTKLLPDYKINWNFIESNYEISKRKQQPIKIFKLK